MVGWEGRELVLENCDSLRRFRVVPALLELLSALADWTSVADLTASGLVVSPGQLGDLVDRGLVEEDREGGAADGAARDWDPHELAVQRHSAVGGYDSARPGERQPPAAFKSRPSGPVTVLPRPRGLSRSLEDALTGRRSVRTYGEQPLPLGALSSVLHHSARISKVSRRGSLGEIAFRPFASGGARSELEVYVVANDVEGLEVGAHYYDARAHELVGLPAGDVGRRRLNEHVHAATGHTINRDPPAVLVITAVFQRVMWKYRGIALGLIYKDVGCLFQTLYLTASAAGLAPCAVGGGAESQNAHWLGLDPLVESQVGCFLIGPPRLDPRRPVGLLRHAELPDRDAEHHQA